MTARERGPAHATGGEFCPGCEWEWGFAPDGSGGGKRYPCVGCKKLFLVHDMEQNYPGVDPPRWCKCCSERYLTPMWVVAEEVGEYDGFVSETSFHAYVARHPDVPAAIREEVKTEARTHWYSGPRGEQILYAAW